jgi:ketosteroid isomerase-like protein
MTTSFFRFISLAGLVCTAVAHSSAWAANPAEEEVMAFTQSICDAFKNRDLAALEQMLAPEFTLVGGDSSLQPRSQAISEVQAGEPRYEVFQNHDMSAHVYGDAAVVQGITSLKGTSAGRPFKVDVRFTDTLVRSQGRWRIVVSHVTRIPAK